jgi:hypothetical protein
MLPGKLRSDLMHSQKSTSFSCTNAPRGGEVKRSRGKVVDTSMALKNNRLLRCRELQEILCERSGLDRRTCMLGGSRERRNNVGTV